MAKQAVDVRHRLRFEREPAAIRFGLSAHRAWSANGPQGHNHGKGSLYSIPPGSTEQVSPRPRIL
jgi:hypothetical protein